MAFVQFSGVSLAFGSRDILIDVSIKLKTGSRAALCGVNGSGKSTLMKVMAGLITCDKGERALEKGVTIAYLPQSGLVYRGRTLLDEAKTVFNRFATMEKRRAAIEILLESVKTDDGKTQSLLAEAENINETLESSGFSRIDKQISLVLRGLGFAESDFSRLTDEFSGGWQMRIALAKVLLENPDVLLLDEPTNYLDIEGRAWLEQWLRGFCGAFLLVSHDRYFLDASVNEVYELFQGRLKRYPGTYTDYQTRRAAEIESLLAAYKRQQEEIAHAEDLIRRFRYKAGKAAMAQELIKKLERMERIEIPENLKKIAIKLPPPPHSGRIALKLDGIGRSYGEKRVLSGLDLCLEAGERLLVVGANGAGKSTLLRIIAGADGPLNDSGIREGTVTYGAGVVSAYFSQEAAEQIAEFAGADTVLSFLESAAPTALIPRLRDMLGAFLFRGDDVFKKISVLSGGEKSRLALLHLLLRPANLFILDEPTNHLDIYAKDALLDALLAYAGTIIFVSHDRAFMEALSGKTLYLSAGRAHRLYYGNYASFLEAAGSSRADDEAAIRSGGKNRQPPPKVSAAAIAREASKRRAAAIRRLEREENALITRLDTLEAEKRSLENQLSSPEIYTSGERSREIRALLAAATAAIASSASEWDRLAAELDDLRKEEI
jgi:ATP-binding cassette subfamily F protein 3